MQSAFNIPLTIYGTGCQTRAFIHISNSMDCIELAIANPPNTGDMTKIFNQVTETHSLIDLANKIVELYPHTQLSFTPNPRKELISNDLQVNNKKFIDLGLTPIFLNDDKIREIYNIAVEYRDRCNIDKIKPMSFW